MPSMAFSSELSYATFHSGDFLYLARDGRYSHFSVGLIQINIFWKSDTENAILVTRGQKLKKISITSQ